jgi:flagellin-specific chaperone FliS
LNLRQTLKEAAMPEKLIAKLYQGLIETLADGSEPIRGKKWETDRKDEIEENHWSHMLKCSYLPLQPKT